MINLIALDRFLKTDGKGRLMLGSEFAGMYFGLEFKDGGIFLQKMQMQPEEITPKSQKNLLEFAGVWKDVSEAELDEFLEDVQTRRKTVAKRKKF